MMQATSRLADSGKTELAYKNQKGFFINPASRFGLLAESTNLLVTVGESDAGFVFLFPPQSPTKSNHKDSIMSRRYVINYPEPFEKKEGFTHVPDAVWDGNSPNRVKYAALKLFMLICYFDQKEGRFPTNGELLKSAKISHNSLIRGRKELIEKGWLSVIEDKYDGYKKEAIPDSIRWEIWERDNFTCKHCGSRRFLTVDHIHPEIKGGSLELGNLQTLCKSCNSRKGAKEIQ